MSISYPDVIGEYVDGPHRHETDGIQYNGYVDPTVAAPGEVALFRLFLQNCVDTPAAVTVTLQPPEIKKGFLFGKRVPLLEVAQSTFELDMDRADAGQLVIPLRMVDEIPAGEHRLKIVVTAKTEDKKPDRVRPKSSKSKLATKLISSPVELNLVGTMGATYKAEQTKQPAEFPFEVAGDPTTPTEKPDLTHEYANIWKLDYMETFSMAIQEVNNRRVDFSKELSLDSLYAAMFAESTKRYADCGVPLRIGEAVTVAKMLTYCSQYFMSSPERINGLLVPIWETAIQHGEPTTEISDVMRKVGYYHILKLSLAMSFGLIAKSVGKHYWPLVERQAVTGFIANMVEGAQEIEPDFLYLPLLMGGTSIARSLKMDGENVTESLALQYKAFSSRPDLFADKELQKAGKIYRRIIKQALET